MKLVAFDSPSGPVEPNYAQALSVGDARQILFISGQIPVGSDGVVPSGFVGQAQQVWANIDAQLAAAGMSRDNLVKVTTFLSDRRYADDNRRVRDAFLGHRRVALTVVLAGIFDESWLLEIEAVAAA